MAHAPAPILTGLCTASGCARPAPDVFVCPSCIAQFRTDCRALAGRRGDTGLVDDLLVRMARQDVTGDTHGIREPGLEPLPTDQPIAEVALPYDPPAADLLRELRVTMNMWVRLLIDRRGLPGAVHPGSDVVELARWLGRHPESVAADQDGGQLVDEVGRLAVKAARVVFPRRYEYLGPCNHWHCADGPDRCPQCRGLDIPEPEHLYVESGAPTVSCRGCGRSWDTRERKAWLLEQADMHTITAGEASRALARFCPPELGAVLTRKKIEQWGRDGRIARHEPHPAEQALDTMGRPVRPTTRYKVADLLRVAAQVVEQASSRRPAAAQGEHR